MTKVAIGGEDRELIDANAGWSAIMSVRYVAS